MRFLAAVSGFVLTPPYHMKFHRFQKLFRIVKVHYTFPQAEQRIFGEVLEDKSGYPENTSLQKKAKAYILEGKEPGIGVGVIDDVYRYM